MGSDRAGAPLPKPEDQRPRCLLRGFALLAKLRGWRLPLSLRWMP